MHGIAHYETFLLTGILLNLTPGNDTMFILSRSMAQGRRAGIVSALGIGTGSLIHTLLAAFGLSLILARSFFLFEFIKYAGAAYLIFLGYKMMVDTSGLSVAGGDPDSGMDYGKVYRAAILTNVLNPKVGLFFIAFLPQFIDPAYKDTPLPFLILGASFVTTGTIWCLILAAFSAALSGLIRRNGKTAGYIQKVCGLTLVALGIKVALTRK